MNSNSKMTRLTEEELLPDDLVGEILSHLPMRSIAQFSTVCKSWNSIINSRCYAQLHLQNYCNTPTSSSTNNDSCVFIRRFNTHTKILKVWLMLPDRLRPAREFSLDFEFGRECQSNICIEFVGPVNGLILIYGISPREGLAICNPYLEKAETLPSPVTLWIDGLVFHRSGLGFDPVRKTIKVVRLLCLLRSKEGRRFNLGMIVDIYSRNTKTWARLEGDVPSNTWAMEPIATSDNDGLFCHWVALRDHDNGCSKFAVLSFDVLNEVFHITQLPQCISDTSRSGVKVFGKGHKLVLFSWSLNRQLFADGTNFMDMWVLSGLGREGHWSLLTGIGPLEHLSKPAGLWKSSGLVLNYVGERRFVIYDYDTHVITNMNIMAGDMCNPRVLEFKGSLVWE